MELAKDYVRHLVHSKSDRVSLVLSDTMRSAVWTCFYKIFVDGFQTSFVVCRNCGHILKYTPKDGTTAMRIHMGKFCGRMKAKAVQGSPQTPLVPTATASGSGNGLTRLTPPPNGNIDEPLDLQKPQLKPPSSILASNNSSNLTSNGHHHHGNPLSNLSVDSPLTAAASAIAAAAAAITGNNGGVSAASFPSLNSSGTRLSLHHASLPIRQMTPTAKAQEILSAFNPIPPSALPTPKSLLFLPGCQQQSNASSSSNTPTSPSAAAQVTSGFGANNLHQRSSSNVGQQGDAPCNLVVKRPTEISAADSNGRNSVGSDGIEAVAVAFKAALATFDEDLHELDAKINETENQLEKLRSKRLSIVSSRDHVNKAAQVMLNSVVDFVTPQDTTPSQPVDAMMDWVRRNSTSSLDSGLKRPAQSLQHPSPLSNWPPDLQLQFSRGPKRLRKSYTAVRRGVPTNNLLGSDPTASSNPTALELLNGVVPMSSASPSKSSGIVHDPSAATSENGGEVPINVIGNSDGSSVANTPPSSGEYGDHDEDHEDNYLGIKSEQMEDIDVEEDSEADNSSANNSLLIDENAPAGANGAEIYPSSLHLQTKTRLFDQIVGAGSLLTVTCATVTSAFVFVGTSSGCVIRYEIRDGDVSNPVLLNPFVDNQSINCIDAWIFGDNDDDFAILIGTDRGVVRVYNPDFTNVLCEKKLNWPVTALRVVAKRHLAYVGLKMGVLVSIDLDKMELAAKIVCGFGSIVDVDWLENNFLFVATEDGSVSVRDLTGQVIANVDMSSISPLSHIRALMDDHEIHVIASSPKRGGLMATALSLTGQPTGRQLVDILPQTSEDNGTIVTQFGRLCQNAIFAVNTAGKMTAVRLSESLSPVILTQEVLDNDETANSELIYASSNNDSCHLITSNGFIKIFRLKTSTN